MTKDEKELFNFLDKFSEKELLDILVKLEKNRIFKAILNYITKKPKHWDDENNISFIYLDIDEFLKEMEKIWKNEENND